MPGSLLYFELEYFWSRDHNLHALNIQDSYIQVAHLVLTGSSRAGGSRQQVWVMRSPRIWRLAKTWRQCARRVRLRRRLEDRARLVEGNPGCCLAHTVMGILRGLSIFILLLLLSVALVSVVRRGARFPLVVCHVSRISLWGDHVWHLPIPVHPGADPIASSSPGKQHGHGITSVNSRFCFFGTRLWIDNSNTYETLQSPFNMDMDMTKQEHYTIKIKRSTASQAVLHSAAFSSPADRYVVTPERQEEACYYHDAQGQRGLMLIWPYSDPVAPFEDPVWRNKLWTECCTCVSMACSAPVRHHHRSESIHPMDPKSPTIQKTRCPKSEARPRV